MNDTIKQSEYNTIFIPFTLDDHMALAGLKIINKDNSKQKIGISFIDSSGYFNSYIENGKLLSNYPGNNLHKFLQNENGMPYLVHAVNPIQLLPQAHISYAAYDILDPISLQSKREDKLLSGTCVYNTIGAVNQIIQTSLEDKYIANELMTCTSDKMIQLYVITGLYQASFEYTKQVLEKYLIPIHNSTKKQLEKIFNVFNLKEYNNSVYAFDNLSQQESLETINIAYNVSSNSNIFIKGQFINKKTKDILLIDFPDIDKSSTIFNTTIMGYQQISNNATINNSAIFGYGKIKNSTINKTKILCSDILNSTLENVKIKTSVVKENSKIYDSTVKDNSEIVSSIVKGNSKISNSTIIGTTIDHSHLSYVISYGNLTIQNANIKNFSEKSCTLLGDDSVNLSNINLNINNDIEDNIIITTNDFLEKLKNSKNSQQYIEYINFFKQNNMDINKINIYDVNNNGIVILSNSKNLAFEIDKFDNTITLNYNKHKNSLSMLSADVTYKSKTPIFGTPQNVEEPKRGCSSCTIM